VESRADVDDDCRRCRPGILAPSPRTHWYTKLELRICAAAHEASAGDAVAE